MSKCGNTKLSILQTTTALGGSRELAPRSFGTRPFLIEHDEMQSAAKAWRTVEQTAQAVVRYLAGERAVLNG